MNALCADEAVVGKSTRSMMFRIVHHRHTNLEAYFGQKGAANGLNMKTACWWRIRSMENTLYGYTALPRTAIFFSKIIVFDFQTTIFTESRC